MLLQWVFSRDSPKPYKAWKTLNDYLLDGE
nr:MAG TPA: hypothetical protein [Caudoviricetes sp.]